jgi:hypothetical protein
MSTRVVTGIVTGVVTGVAGGTEDAACVDGVEALGVGFGRRPFLLHAYFLAFPHIEGRSSNRIR